MQKKQYLISYYTVIILLILTFKNYASDPEGFHNANWGASPAEVRTVSGAKSWKSLGADGFPAELNIEVFQSQQKIAGYPASVKYYFFEGKYFQSTVRFNFDELKNFDFNYNVFISVDKYYRTIRDKTLMFVFDIYDLLRKKYGKKEPIFKGLDPRNSFKNLDIYVRQEVWNLRYHPSEYYKRIVTSSYARWDFPKTRIIFSINISAFDKRFDYILSATSLKLQKDINDKKDSIRMNGL